MNTMMILDKLRTLASELGLELIYMVGKSKSNYQKVTYENFLSKKYIGLLKNGEIFCLPIKSQDMKKRMERAIARKKRAVRKEM